MRLFITFQVDQTVDGEPVWTQVDWRIIESGNGYGRDVARAFAATQNAGYDTLYATVQVADTEARDQGVQGASVHYWRLSGEVREADPSAFWSSQATEGDTGVKP